MGPTHHPEAPIQSLNWCTSLTSFTDEWKECVARCMIYFVVPKDRALLVHLPVVVDPCAPVEVIVVLEL